MFKQILREVDCVVVFIDDLTLEEILLDLLVTQVLLGILVHLE
jgi:hypothetical protein